MTALTISGLITDKLGQTETDLSAQTSIDWSGAKSRAIALAKLELYGYEIGESDIGDGRIKNHLALMACLPLIELAIDYYTHETRLADTKQQATIHYYNRVETLEKKRQRYRQELTLNAATVLDLIDTSAIKDTTIDVSTLHTTRTAHTHMLTPSPWARKAK